MNPPNINYVWSEILIEELVRNGVCRFIISPGSRNSPLVIAAAKNPKSQTIIHTDERGAAFYALGYAKAIGKPAVLIATSGTANANYYPAVIEASRASVPMILLTSDRPVELRDTDAPQTMNQVNLYGQFVRWSFDLPAPSTEIEPQFVLTTVDQAVYRSIRSPSGPVQLNCQFREPLDPRATWNDFSIYLQPIKNWETAEKPFTEYCIPILGMEDKTINESIARITNSQKSLIIAGPMHGFTNNENITKAAEMLGMPLMADVSSGLRFGGKGSANVMVHYDSVLRTPEFIEQNKPDLVLQLGGLPVSKPLSTYLEQFKPETIYVNDSPFRQDPFHQVSHRIEMNPHDFCKTLIEKGVTASSQLLQSFGKAEQVAEATLNEIFSEENTLSELVVARMIVKNLPENHNLFAANSMPIRDLDASGLKRDAKLNFGVNRGVNGIDGTIATAVGFAAGNGRPTTVVLGDLAMLHDLNSLLLVRNTEIQMTIVVINNNGGGIFSFLPIVQSTETFEEFFATPNDITFEHTAAQFDLNYCKPTSIIECKEMLLQATSGEESVIIEIQTDRQENVRQHQSVWAQISSAIRTSLHD